MMLSDTYNDVMRVKTDWDMEKGSLHARLRWREVPSPRALVDLRTASCLIEKELVGYCLPCNEVNIKQSIFWENINLL